MKIRDARVIVCSPGRNYVTLRIETDGGISGIGDATVNGREMAVVAYLRDHVVPTLIGRDAARIEDTWQYLYRGAYWRGGPIGMAAIAAVDVALWDIKAKAAGMPLYQLFGGASREHMLCYAHARATDIPALLDHVAALRARGFRAFRLQCGIPGLPEQHSQSTGPAAERPAEQLWDSGAYLRFAPRMLEAARSALGA